MCGIAGLISERIHSPDVPPKILAKWHALLRHRGPDGWGWYQCPLRALLLFHRRLAITGVNNGFQPLSNANGNIWLVFNGEIYNHRALRKDLEAAGFRFQTETDGEVIVHLYEQKGIAAVKRLEGEFAFALYDAAAGKMYLVRDRFGIKPLYYARKNHELWFGSEVKAIFADETFPRKFDRKAFSNYVHTFYFDTDSLFEGIKQVKPAHFICFDIDKNELREESYWRLPLDAPPRQQSEADLVAECRHLFMQAVKERLPEEVPYGIYLSGGLDSACITGAATASGAGNFPLFSIGFDVESYDELPRSVQLAQKLELPQHIVRVEKGSLKEPFLHSLWHSEIPVLNTHGAAKHLLARKARELCKVVLTGEGADELFMGYDLFQHLQAEEEGHGTKERLSVAQARLSGKLLNRKKVEQVFGAYPYSMQRLFYLKQVSTWLLNRKARDMANWDWETEIPRHIAPEHWKGLDSLEITQLFLIETDFPAYLLNNLGDRQEMAAGLEGRVPFLDRRLAEFSCSLPRSMKLRNGQGKYIIREAMKASLPAGFTEQPKQVFYAPAFHSIAYFDDREYFSPFTGKAAFEGCDLFSRPFFTFLTLLARALPARNRLLPVVESVATFILSTHILYDMYIRDFDAWQQRLAPLSELPDLELHRAG